MIELVRDSLTHALMITGFVFVMMLVIGYLNVFTQGAVPFSVLLASSIVQDGHGMLPLLADSLFDFFQVKSIHFFVGFLIGLRGYFANW
jgi:hypothetical protein